MPRYRLTVAYDGTNFHGWQKQCTAAGDAGDAVDVRTAQGVLEQAVRKTVREPVSVLGASRTDAGVHAVGQVAAFTSDGEMETDRLCAAINARLPDDMQVRRATIVSADFSPISDAIAKGYRYRISWGRAVRGGPPRPLFQRFTTFWTPYDLDATRMNDAARRLIGEHDFASFTRVGQERESTIRTIHDCRVTAGRGRRLHIHVAGDGFLYNMVRIIAGTLLEVGRGRTDPESMGDIVAAADRRAAGPTLPPQGLCLMWIKYPRA